MASSIDLIECVGDWHLINFCRVIQAFIVIIQTKNRVPIMGFVATNTFKNRRTVMQTMRHHMHSGVLPTLDFAVVPNVIGIGLCHDELLNEAGILPCLRIAQKRTQ